MSEIILDFKKAWKLINQSQKIFLTTHEGTDGDDLGSLLAMRRVLTTIGKEVISCVKGGVPHTLHFLPGSESVKSEFINMDYDLVISFGCGNIKRPGFQELEKNNYTKINIDHHPDNTNFGDVNIVDSTTAAVAELVFYFFKTNSDIVIDRDIATCLLTGIFTDTGGFQHSNTSAKVFDVAADLLKRGARIDRIATETFGSKRPQTLKAWAKGLENTRFDSEKQMVYSVLTEEDLQSIGADDDDLGGFVEMLNHIPQAKFSLLLRQSGPVVKGSLRSDPRKKTDVSQIAKQFGGGGHKYASGFKINGKLVRGENGWEIK